MSLIINSITYTPEFTTGTTDWLLGVIGNKIVVTIDVTAEWIAYADSDNLMQFDAAGFIYWENNNFYAEGFRIGDSIEISGTTDNNGTFTISNFDSTYERMYLVESVTAELGADTAVITGVTPLEGLSFRYNLIENASSESYLSLVDGNELRFTHNDLDYTDTSWKTCTQQGVYKSNHLGSVRVKGNNTDLNRFTIEHTFYIAPFAKPDDLSDLEQEAAPEYFLDSSCLKYIYNVRLMRDLANPNIYHENNSSVFMYGNTGWFNENFNGNIPEFTSNGISFTVNGDAVDSPDYNQDTDFSFIINSASGKFSNNNTKFLVNHFFLPNEDADFKNTATDFTENFMFDRALHTGTFATAVNGENNGTSKQVLKNIAITYTSASQVTVTGTISLSSAYKTRVEAATNKNFCLWVITQDHTLATDIADTVAVWPGLLSYDTDLSNAEVGDIQTTFHFHPSESTAVPYGGMFVEDGVIGDVIFGVDISNGAEIQSATVTIKATDGTDSFTLEEKEFSFASAVVQSGIQQVNVQGSRGFQLKSGNPFNKEYLIRRSDLDTATTKYYQILYGFKIRWEDYIQLANVNADFYDSSEDFNGFNNNWSRFISGSWGIKFETSLLIEENGFVNTFTNSKTLYAYDYGSATDWSAAVWTCTDEDGNSLGAYLPNTGIVTVTATFTKLSGAEPAITAVEGLIEVEPYEDGGIYVIRQTSTVWPYDASGVFRSLTGLSDDLLKKQKAGSNYKFSTEIDCSKLPAGSQYRLSARIYETGIPPLGGGKQFQDDVYFEFQDGGAFEFQDA